MQFEKKIVLFGAGTYGLKALDKFGKDKILYFCDNNLSLIGSEIEGKKVIGINQLIELKDEVNIVISISKHHQSKVYEQLCELGLKDNILDYKFGVNVCKGIYSVVEKAKSVGVVIYGAGFWGELAYNIFSLFGIKPICFCDDNIEKAKDKYCNTDVILLEEAVQKYSKSVFISAADDTPIIGVRSIMDDKLRINGVYSEFSNLKLENYMFLLDVGTKIFENFETNQFTVKKNSFKSEYLNKIMILNHMGHSGSFYFENLLDGHKNILTIPFGMGINDLKNIYVSKLRYLSRDELLIELCALMNAHFETSIDTKNLNKLSKLTKNLSCRNEFGEDESRVAVNPFRFIENLSYELKQMRKNSFSNLIKALFSSYNNTIGKKYDSNEEYWIFYHMHQNNYDLSNLDDMILKTDFKRLEYIFIIREPIQHLFSCINHYTKILKVSAAMISSFDSFKRFISSDLGYMFEKQRSNFRENVKVIRFEDLKFNHKKVMNLFCEWAEIEYSDAMEKTTVNEIEVYFTTLDENDKKIYITGNNPHAVRRSDFSSQMTSYDILRLNIAFQKFKEAYGYEVDVPNFKIFSKEFLEEMYLLDFKFVKTLVEAAEKTGDVTNSRGRFSKEIKALLLDFIKNYKDDTEYYDYFKVNI